MHAKGNIEWSYPRLWKLSAIPNEVTPDYGKGVLYLIKLPQTMERECYSTKICEITFTSSYLVGMHVLNI